jgi:hypothetical protein
MTKKKKRGYKPSPEVAARVNRRLRAEADARAAKQGRTRTSPELIEKVFSDPSALPKHDTKAHREKEKARKAAEARARRDASSTSKGTGAPKAKGKGRGSGGGRVTRGS